jgi:hydrogenase nickel incorporation protein HypA/HybF
VEYTATTGRGFTASRPVHELSIVQALIDQVDEEVRRSGHTGRVVRLNLIIGRLSGVHADSIRFGFEMLSPDTLLAGARLEIDEPLPDCRCAACAAITPIEELIVACPRCGSDQITIDGGQELLLQSIELEEPS